MVPSRSRLLITTLAALGCAGGDLVVPAEPEPGDGGRVSATRSTLSADPSVIQTVSGTSTILVTVREEDGDPVEGATVALQGTGSGITLTQPGTVTGPDGIATGILRSDVPGTKVISAVVDGSVQVSQTAQVTFGLAPASRIEPIEGIDQSAPAGQEVPIPPAIRVLDALGQPVAGFAVTFAVTSGGGSVDVTTQITNADGIARVRWTLGPAAGTNTLEARAGSLGGSPVIFTAEGTSTGGEGGGPSEEDVNRLIFLVPPREVREGETFSVEVALVDADGNVVPLSGIFTYLDLFKDGDDTPTNMHLRGEHFENTENGVAVFDIRVEKKGRYRLRALTDDLPALGPHGPEPYLFSEMFRVD